MRNNLKNMMMALCGLLFCVPGNADTLLTNSENTTSDARKKADLIVAQDGSGDYTTLQAAIDAAPDNSEKRKELIFIV